MKNFLLKTWLMTFMLVLGTSTAWADWTRCTAVSDLTSGGTFIIGYEAKANSGVIVPMKNSGGTATTTAAGYMAAFTTGIDMASVTKTEDYEVSIVTSSVKDAVCIKIGDSYLGNTNTKNNCKLFSEESINTAFGVSCGENDVFTFRIAANATYNTLQYNSSSGSERFAVYSATQKNLVVYKKTNNAGAATLQSISIGGDYTKSFYTGDKFYFGGTVTANYSDNSSKDVTAKTEFNGYNPSMVGQQTVTASYTEADITKTATYGITVSDFTTHAGTYTIDLDKEFYGLQTTGNNAAEQSAEKRGVTVVSGCTSSATTKTYYAATHIRYYTDSYLKLTVPNGYVLTNVELVRYPGEDSWKAEDGDITVSAGAYTFNTNTWTGASNTLEFDFAKQCRVAAIVVTYEEAGNVEVPTLTSIEVTGTPEALWLNSEFNHNGITVNANWSNGTVTDVTNYCEFSGYNMSVAGDQTVTITYEGKTTTYTLTVKDNRFASLAALVAAGAPTAEGTPVTVTLTNDVIKSIFKTSKGDRNGIFLEANGQQVEIYCKDVPEDWAAGGTVSGTLTNCTWKLYNTTWELCPANWDELTYTAPAAPVLYTVTISTPEHGAIEVKNGENVVKSGIQVEAGTTLTLTFTPEDGYNFLSWTATDALGAHSFTDQKNTWTLNGDVNFSATFQKEKEPTWDLTKAQTTKASTSQLIWRNHEEVYMEANKNRPDGPSATTNANNYYPGSRDTNGELKGYTSTRFYTNSTLAIGPANGITISSIVITATTESYAKAYTLEQDGTEVRNATVSRDGTVVTLIPEDGKQEVVIVFGATASATSVDVVYSGEVIPEPDPVYYTITVDNNIIGGAVTADRETAEEGDKVTLSASSESGYKFDSWNVHLVGSEENISVSGDNVFVMPAGNVVVSAVFKSNTEIDESGNLIVTYNFNDKNAYPEDFPKASSPAHTANGEYFIISGNSIGISAPDNYYVLNADKTNQCIMLGKTKVDTKNNNAISDNTAYLEFPAKEGYKLVNVKATTSASVAGGVSLNIFDSSWKSYCVAQETVSNSKATYEFELNGAVNKAYRLSSITNGKNLQFDNIVLTYELSDDGGGTSYEGATIGTLTKYIDGLLKGQGSLGEVKKIENAILRK